MFNAVENPDFKSSETENSKVSLTLKEMPVDTMPPWQLASKFCSFLVICYNQGILLLATRTPLLLLPDKLSVMGVLLMCFSFPIENCLFFLKGFPSI